MCQAPGEHTKQGDYENILQPWPQESPAVQGQEEETNLSRDVA